MLQLTIGTLTITYSHILFFFSKNLQAAIYKAGSVCAAFLANIGTSDATVSFNGKSYHMPAWSVSILPDCKNVAFNTAKVCDRNFAIL